MNYEMKDFNKDVIERSKKIPVLVDFWAEWCGPCRVLSPILEKLAQKYSGKWTLVKVNTDENPELAAEYGIRGIPNVKLFADGNVVNEFVGALSEPMVEEWLTKVIPGKSAKKIEEAKKLQAGGKESQASKLLQDILFEEPDNEAAKLLLAKIFLFGQTEKAAELLKNLNGAHENYELAGSLNTIIELFNKLGNGELPENNIKEKYISAIEDLKKKNFNSALEKFIEVIKKDRSYDDDGARKACIAIFKYLGEENETTLQYRREFGRALYV
ncbi:MAG TPA: thioredoxin [Ignavibacteriaceae bacterium]|nr:thioredoxin [Ignavibacteriaceae bacterium]